MAMIVIQSYSVKEDSFLTTSIICLRGYLSGGVKKLLGVL